MLTRIPCLLVVGLTLAWSPNAFVAAQEKAQDATVVKVAKGKLTLTFKGDDQKHTHDVARDAKITLDDKVAKLEALKEGFHVRVTMDSNFVITRIEAHSKKKK